MLDTTYYERIFESFKVRFPMWAKDAVGYCPKHTHAIRVTLNDGSKIDYNYLTETTRFVKSEVVATAADVDDDECRSIFAANLSEQLRMRGMGQKYLAEATGLSQAVISKYLRCASTPGITNAKKIAMVLGCGVDDLMD